MASSNRKQRDYLKSLSRAKGFKNQRDLAAHAKMGWESLGAVLAGRPAAIVSHVKLVEALGGDCEMYWTLGGPVPNVNQVLLGRMEKMEAKMAQMESTLIQMGLRVERMARAIKTMQSQSAQSASGVRVPPSPRTSARGRR